MWAGKKDTNTPLDQTMNFFMGLLRNEKKAVALLYAKQEHSLKDDSEEIKDLNNKVKEQVGGFATELAYRSQKTSTVIPDDTVNKDRLSVVLKWNSAFFKVLFTKVTGLRSASSKIGFDINQPYFIFDI